MKSTITTIAACVVAHSIFHGVYAQSDTWAARGSGIKSCEYWVASFKNDEDLAAGLVDWLSGFMSGVNAGRSSGKQSSKLGRNATMVDLVQWMNKYCVSHPRNSIGMGAQVLMYELIEGGL